MPQNYQAAPPYHDQTYYDQSQPLRGSYSQAEPGYPQPQGYPPGQDPRALDPQGYEFGAYATQAPAYGAHDGTAGAGRMQPAAPPPPPGFGAPFPPQYAQPGYDQAYGAQPAAAGDEYYDDEDADDDDDEDDRPRRFGFLKIATSLIVAIALGGGAAYGYKIYGGKLLGGHPPVMLKADASPAKTQPQAQGDRFAAQNGGERLSEPVPQVVASGDSAASDAIPAGARRVQTIAITPGNVPGGEPASAEPPMRPTITMPGLAVEGLQSGPARTVTQPPVQAASIGRAGPAPIAPRILAAVEQPTLPPTIPKAAPVRRVVVARPAKASDAYSPTHGTAAASIATATAAPAAAAPAAVGAAPAKSGANGYIAVLFSSQGNVINARKALDALQAKFPDVLGGKATDVTEATVKGQKWYRGIVGPPGSREAVKQLCGQLKAAGHPDCFAAAY